jgi:hypothetical protein
MKIYFASYFDPDTHGPGRKIGMSAGCPKNLKDEFGYECTMKSPMSPGDEYWDYMKTKKASADLEDEDKQKAFEAASALFTEAYNKRLADWVLAVQEAATARNKTVQEVIELQDGDTLLTWERSGHLSYRPIAMKVLETLGYECEER